MARGYTTRTFGSSTLTLTGSNDLKRRLAAVKVAAFKPFGRRWANAAVDIGKPIVPHDTGKLKGSIVVGPITQRKAVVKGWYTAYFVDAGTVAHDITAKAGKNLVFTANGRTIFAKQVHKPSIGARPFRGRMAHEALDREPFTQEVVDAWNRAA